MSCLSRARRYRRYAGRAGMPTIKKETQAEKATRPARRGYLPSRRPGRCCLCDGKIASGQFIGRMPAAWRPETKRRHAHYRYVDGLGEEVREPCRGRCCCACGECGTWISAPASTEGRHGRRRR